MNKDRVREAVQTIEAPEQHVAVSDAVRSHAMRLIDFSKNYANVFTYASVTTGGNGTIMIVWGADDFLATIDIGVNTYTASVMESVTYERLMGFSCHNVDSDITRF